MIDICICGHVKSVHPCEFFNQFAVCDGCFRKNRPCGIRQINSIDCNEFRPDNLKYLESLIDER